MGCVHSRGTTYSPQRALERLKLENGYLRGENAGRPPVGKDFSKSSRGGGEAKNFGGGERKISRESENGINGGGKVLLRISVKKIHADGVLDVWPNWLVDNVPEDALAAKSADSYDKLAKAREHTAMCIRLGINLLERLLW